MKKFLLIISFICILTSANASKKDLNHKFNIPTILDPVTYEHYLKGSRSPQVSAYSQYILIENLDFNHALIDGLYYILHTNTMMAYVTHLTKDMEDISGNINYVSGHVVIPEKVKVNDMEFTVTGIGYGAFYGCENLTSIQLPNTVFFIDAYAFAGTNLSSIELGNGLQTIGYGAFAGTSFTSFVIPDSVVFLDGYIFDSCPFLESITVGSKLEAIGDYAFINSPALKYVTMGENIKEIGEAAFALCPELVEITIPNSVVRIGETAFYEDENLSSVEFGNSLQEIYPGAFLGCNSLTSVTLPNSVVILAEWAFAKCNSLQKVIMGEGIEEISIGVFEMCGSLNEVVFSNNLQHIGEYVFNECFSLSEITIPENVYWIGEAAFADCSLTKITCLPVEPPYCEEIVFYPGDAYTDATLYVPSMGYKAYASVETWMNFENIIALDYVAVTELSIDPSELTIAKGETATLTVKLLPENATDKTVVWNSSDTSVATIEDGVVLAVNVGEAVITATCGDAEAQCLVNVIKDSGIESLLSNPDEKFSIYTSTGALVKKDCDSKMLDHLAPGIYVIRSSKEAFKIIIR